MWGDFRSKQNCLTNNLFVNVHYLIGNAAFEFVKANHLVEKAASSLGVRLNQIRESDLIISLANGIVDHVPRLKFR